jgi:hypothetical protein
LPAEKLPRICQILGSYKLLDALEQEAGSLAFSPSPATEPTDAELVTDVHRFIKEVGDALHVLAETLKRGILNEREFNHGIAELDDVILECARLKQRLELQRKNITEGTKRPR